MTQKKSIQLMFQYLPVKCPVVTVETIWHVPARGRRLAPSSSALRRSRSI